MTTFKDIGLNAKLLKAVTEEGYDTPTPIQAQAIPHLLDGRDLLGIAQTGTGKTAAFALPTLDLLIEEPGALRAKHTRVLVLAPTRELAGQIADSFRTYSKFMDCRVETVFGGVGIGRQIQALQKGVHVLVATPGRLLDLMNQGAVKLGEVEVLILDEADQMLDMGFIHDLKKILAKVPADRQTLLFSATMPKAIAELAGQYLDDPVKVSIAPESTTAERVDQGVYHVATSDKLDLLEAVLATPDMDRALVFSRTKHGAEKVVRKLMAKGFSAMAIHGNKSQPQRLKALEAFKDGRCKILIATDIAARGIDVDGISHVINFEMPNVPEQYVHRIGRTARAGRAGIAVSLVAEDELYYLRDVEKVTRQHIPLLPAPEGCEAIVRPEPSRDLRVPKPKGPAGRSGYGGGNRSQGRRPQRPASKKPHGRPGTKHRPARAKT
ncbi:MAG: DEAD/DEAH box helicase [Hyphomonas sp.]|uniref:DEAD/DEAH box helicase n=1 Tax=Hyphomonas sp. TaxID=87 RepID=UPI00352811F8